MRRKLCIAVLTLALLCTLAPSALAFDTAYVGRTETLGRGLTYSVMLDENGTLLGVGQGGYYELGGIYVYGGTEGAAPILSGVISLSAGPVHAGAIDRNGGLWMWGRNDSGEIGNGQEGWYDEGLQSLIQREPVQVLDHVAAVSCGWGNTAAIRTDGTLWTWGSNLLGELGNGTEENSLVPVQVLEDVAAVQTGIDGYLNQTAAVRTDGSLWTWGADGELWGEWTLSSTVPVEQTDLRIQLPMSTAEAKARLAWYSEQPVTVNGGAETLSSYVLLDENGYETNYIGLGQLYALMVDRTAMTIEAGESLNVTTDAPELSMTGDRFDPALGASRAYRPAAVTAYVDGQPHTLSAIVLTDDNGTEYTYYKLRDLGLALGFDVGWNAGTGVTVDFPPPGAE